MRTSATFDKVLYTIISIISFLFLTPDYAILVGLILSIALVAIYYVKKRIIVNKLVVLLFFLSSFVAFEILVQTSRFFSIDEAIKEIQRYSIYSLLILVLYNLKVDYKYFSRLWRFLLYFSLLIALIQFAKIFPITELLINIYGQSIEFDLAENYTNLDNFRSGSIFINSNHYIKFINATFAILAQEIYLRYKLNAKLWTFSDALTISAVIVSNILTGSRTGLLIFAALVGIYCIAIVNQIIIGKIKKRVVYHLIFSTIVIGILLAWSILLGSEEMAFNSTARVIDVNLGFETSMAYKYETLFNILDFADISTIFIGFGPFENKIEYLTLVDFDLGYIIAFYGLIGIIIYVLMCRYVIIDHKNDERSFKLFYMSLVIIILLGGLTSGVFLALHIFAVLLSMLCVGKYDSRLNFGNSK